LETLATIIPAVITQKAGHHSLATCLFSLGIL
jgi:hypothetical protein